MDVISEVATADKPRKSHINRARLELFEHIFYPACKRPHGKRE
jgi:hypothetical protein